MGISLGDFLQKLKLQDIPMGQELGIIDCDFRFGDNRIVVEQECDGTIDIYTGNRIISIKDCQYG